MELKELIDAFTSSTGIDSAHSVDGVWRFSADEHVFGLMEDSSGESLLIFGEIPAPQPGSENAFRKAVLEANFFLRGTGGATFSINPESGAYTVFRSERLDRLTPESFFSLVEKFVNTLATWKWISVESQAESVVKEPEETPPASLDPTLGFMSV